MVDHENVLALRTEHDEIRIRVYLHVVAGWPVKQIIRGHRLLFPRRIGRGDLSSENVAPVRTLAEVTFQSFEQGSGVHARSQAEVLGTELVVTDGICERYGSTAFYVTLHNRSDDLFMFLKKKLTIEDGIVPNQTY